MTIVWSQVINLSTEERQYWSVINTVIVPRWLVFFPSFWGCFNSKWNIRLLAIVKIFFYRIKYDISTEMWNSWVQVEMFIWAYPEFLLNQVCRVKFTTLLIGFVGSHSLGSLGRNCLLKLLGEIEFSVCFISLFIKYSVNDISVICSNIYDENFNSLRDKYLEFEDH